MKKLFASWIIAGIAFPLLLMSCGNNRRASQENKDVTSQGRDISSQQAIDTSSAAGLSGVYDTASAAKLTGHWLRSDGDYIIQIVKLSGNGKASIGYFNPGPVNVEKGEWLLENGRFYIHVVLRDVNYPGSTYTLGYNPGDDTFTGNYFQAVEGIYYDVIFSREK